MKIPKLTKYQLIIEIIALLLLLACVVATLICYPSLPEQVPSHYDINGNIDKWSSRGNVFVVLAIDAAMYLLLVGMLFFPKALKPNTLRPLDMRYQAQIQHETISMMAECTLFCVLLFGYIQLFSLMQKPMITWPMWVIVALVLVSCLIRTKRLSKYTLSK